jgi:hypothetical protein
MDRSDVVDEGCLVRRKVRYDGGVRQVDVDLVLSVQLGLVNRTFRMNGIVAGVIVGLEPRRISCRIHECHADGIIPRRDRGVGRELEPADVICRCRPPYGFSGFVE